MNRKRKKQADVRERVSSIIPEVEFMSTLDLALKFILTIATIMITALFFIFLHDYMTQNPFFSIRHISIQGTHHLTPEQVKMQAGISPGENLLAVNSAAVEKKLMHHPWIKAAVIKRIFPRDLEITIQEQEPLARISITNHAPLIINTKGEPFTQASPRENPMEKKLPLIKGILLEEKNNKPGFYGALFQKILDLLSHDFGFSFTAITADNLTGITVEALPDLGPQGPSLQDEKPIVMKLGTTHFASKFKIAKKIIGTLHHQNRERSVDTMDLFNPERVVVTLDNRPTADRNADT